MKKIDIINLLIVISSITATISAYENSFYNNTDTPIGIAIQYDGIDGSPEPLYSELIHPHSMGIFKPDEISNPGNIRVPAIKWAFCLDKVYYIENPTPAEKRHHFEKTYWKKIPITWVEEKSMTKIQPKKQRGIRRTIKQPVSSGDKSLCRDRHFDIIRNEYDKIIITSSTND
jgi:hypothetical protein